MFKILMGYLHSYFLPNVPLHESQSALRNVQIFDIHPLMPVMRLIKRILKNINDYANIQVNFLILTHEYKFL